MSSVSASPDGPTKPGASCLLMVQALTASTVAAAMRTRFTSTVITSSGFTRRSVAAAARIGEVREVHGDGALDAHVAPGLVLAIQGDLRNHRQSDAAAHVGQ